MRRIRLLILVLALLPVTDVAEAGRTYTAYALRQTHWLVPSPAAKVESGIHQITEVAYDADEEFSLSLGFLLTDNLEDLVTGFFGAINYSNFVVNIERGRVSGTFKQRAGGLAPFDSENRFDNSYLRVGLGLDLGRFWEEEYKKYGKANVNGVAGLGYIRFVTPTSVSLSSKEDLFVRSALDVSMESHIFGLWFIIDNLRALMRGFEGGLAVIYESDGGTRLAWGANADIILGVAIHVASDEVKDRVERFTGLSYSHLNLGFNALSFNAGLGTGPVFTFKIGHVQIGLAAGVEGRFHHGAGLNAGAGEVPQDRKDGAVYFRCNCNSRNQAFWGPYGKLAVLW